MDVKSQVAHVPIALKTLGYDVRLNVLSDRVEVNGQPISDVVEAELLTNLREQHVTSSQAARDAWIAEAARYKFHPVKNYLNSLSYQGGSVIADLATYFNSDGNFETWLRRWLIGAVRRGLAWRGDQNRTLVLVGKQNLGKSKFVDWLCPPALKRYFLARPIFPDVKDDRLALAYTWIWEVSELGATTSKADRNMLKHFLSREWIVERPPYGKHPIEKPALTNFIGTANSENSGLFYDPTGYRRFMVTKIDAIDWSYAETINLDQLWAEASMLYLAGEPADLTPDEVSLAENISKELETENPVEGMILKHFSIDPSDTIAWKSTAEILEKLSDPNLGGSWRGTTNQLAKQLAEAMTNLGAKRTRRRPVSGQNPVWGYEGVKC
jgi:predicted P-loop ATPase